MLDWQTQMDALCSTARYFATCNVIDIVFVNGEHREVYVAISPDERQRGLAEVASLDLDGMLFFYANPSFVPFTMAKMMMDLDIAWYNQSGELLKFGTFQAGSQAPLFCQQAFSYVLEAPADTLPQVDLKVRL